MSSPDDMNKILDNNPRPLAGYLNSCLPNSSIFRLVSAYFSIYGYGQVEYALGSVQDVRLLFGEPSSAGDAISGKADPMTFSVKQGLLSNKDEDSGVTIGDRLGQRELAKRCAEWVKRDSDSGRVQVRTIKKSNFMHGKMYHISKADADTAVVGSSNFTNRGLGGGKESNIELNIIVDSPTHEELEKWFDDIWRNEDLVDTSSKPKNDLLAALEHWHKEYSPEFLYYKTLFELFRKELDALEEEDNRLRGSDLKTSKIWGQLYDFQKDGAKSVIDRLLRYNGCILADSVGLGKTYTALAVIKYFESRNERVLVLCPKKLEENWRIYQFNTIPDINPFYDDEFDYVQRAHTDLSRQSLANHNWSHYGLIVIDESHNFRNDSSKRYEKLMQEAIVKGCKTKVLLLSATPVNTSLRDLRNQVYLMTSKKNDAFKGKDSLQIPNLRTMFDVAEKGFKKWEQDGNQNKSELLNALGGDFQRLFGALTIARSRKQITNFYGKYIEEHGKFPVREAPVNMYLHTDTETRFSYEEVYNLITEIKFYIYQPSRYVKAEVQYRKKEYEIQFAGMMRINYLKRFESSAEALRLTLERTIKNINGRIERIDKYLENGKDGEAEIESEGYRDDDDDDFIVNPKAEHSYHLSELDVEKWRHDMLQDITALQQVMGLVEQVSPAPKTDEKGQEVQEYPERDAKLRELRRRICSKIKEGRNGGKSKLLVFTTFKDTANYLYRHIVPLCKDLGVNPAMVAGDETKRERESGKNTYIGILDAFSPVARKAQGQGDGVDILVATDCISEGQNLQDCDTVLNYDIHWNPVRIIQRFGRIDRIGSKNDSVKMVNFWPHSKLEEYLGLRSKVVGRMMLSDTTATGSDNTLVGDHAQRLETEQGFHAILARRIKEEVPDLDDLPGTVTMGSLTLIHFQTQLLKYLRAHRPKFEHAPPGIYAVTDAATDGYNDGEGVIFFFRQKNPAEDGRNNPTHPFYLVHVLKDGGVRRHHMQVHEILHLFEKLALPHSKEITELCNAFANEVKEKQMSHYSAMTRKAIDGIVEQDKKIAIQNWEENETPVPPKEECPCEDNLELITWLVIKNR